jgi:hypothetical protein
MTDYTHASGAGTMMIRDTGSVVQYWFKAGFTNDFYHGLHFEVDVNGVVKDLPGVNYPTGANWLMIYSSTVSTTQTVTFKLLTATGISGFGGPTTFSQAISRSTAPGIPAPPIVGSPRVNSLGVSWTPPSSGGSAINNYQVAYGIDPTAASFVLYTTNTSITLSGLATGTTYYVWIRAFNAIGFGGWSNPSSGTTDMGGYVNVGGAWHLAEPWVKSGGVWHRCTTKLIGH